MPPVGVGIEASPVNQTMAPLGVVVQPEVFFARTKARKRAVGRPIPGSGVEDLTRIPATGILGKLRVKFVGAINVTLGAGTVTTGPRWPYGFLDSYQLSADARTDIFRWDGIDAHVMRAVRHPSIIRDDGSAFAGGVKGDVFPIGFGNGRAIPTGASNITLSWEIPVSLDDAALIGALFTQSDNVYIGQRLQQVLSTDLLVAAGGATIDSITGSFYTHFETYTIPSIPGAQGGQSLAVPDISFYHSIIAKDEPFSAAGDVEIELTRGSGQLSRLLIQAIQSTDRAVTTDPVLRASPELNDLVSVRVEYGSGEKPLVWDPAHLLVDENVDTYGQQLPYGYYAIDFLRENPARDAVNMQGLTDLKLVVEIGAGAVIAAKARVRVVQEMMLRAG